MRKRLVLAFAVPGQLTFVPSGLSGGRGVFDSTGPGIRQVHLLNSCGRAASGQDQFDSVLPRESDTTY